MNLFPVLVLGFVMGLVGCADVPPTPQQVASIGYGSPLPANYKVIIQDYLNTHLKDPFSAVVTWRYAPVQTWIRNAPMQGSQLILGWKVVCDVNAKNSFGAYTGFKPYLFMIRDGAVVFEVSGEDEVNTALLEGYQ
jgi:hypothetical protein